MDLETFLTAVFCVSDDFLRAFTREHAPRQRLRARGPTPVLADSEVRTVEVAGEVLGLDTDQAIYAHFRRYHAVLFPGLAAVHRTTFARQAATLWAVKRALWQALLTTMRDDPAISIIDSVPSSVCRFARAKRCRTFAGEAADGYDELVRQTCYGVRAQRRVAWPGVIPALELVPANTSDIAAAPAVLVGATGWALADRNSWSPARRAALRETALLLVAPRRTTAQERRHGDPTWPRWLVAARRRIATVLGQLAERFHAKRVWARERWPLTARWLRKVVAHPMAVLLCQEAGLPPLTFAELLT